jgi:hypothetical protein
MISQIGMSSRMVEVIECRLSITFTVQNRLHSARQAGVIGKPGSGKLGNYS